MTASVSHGAKKRKLNECGGCTRARVADWRGAVIVRVELAGLVPGVTEVEVREHVGNCAGPATEQESVTGLLNALLLGPPSGAMEMLVVTEVPGESASEVASTERKKVGPTSKAAVAF